MSDQTAPTYLEPIRDELDRLRRENATLTEGNRVACARFEAAEARLATERHEHALRSDALNRTGASNDTMRAQLAAVEKVLDDVDAHIKWTHDTFVPARFLRAALAVPTDQETAK